MWSYKITNDFRPSSQCSSMYEIAAVYLDSDDKLNSYNKSFAENVQPYIGLQFGLKSKQACAKEAYKKNMDSIYLNFIKKFQFPNPTQQDYQQTINDRIKLAPLREIVKILFYLKGKDEKQAYLTIEEISNFIFYNPNVAKTEIINYDTVITDIIKSREIDVFPDYIAPEEEKEDTWKDGGRSLKDLITTLANSNFILYLEHRKQIVFQNFSTYEKHIKNIIDYNTFLEIDSSDTKTVLEEKYLNYFNNNFDTFSCENNVQTNLSPEWPRNRILFGAPGTGKSYRLNQERIELLQTENNFERVTFHPEYNYANFVGTYKPVPIIDENHQETISYKYVPGPFMRIYAKALKSIKSGNPKPYLLIIEEINRANVASVFGDVFQLLDRNEFGASEYEIQASEDIKKYLVEELGGNPEEYSTIQLPSNLFIWATMNSADQGVYPMDTAFKRRWEFTYIDIDKGENDISDVIIQLGENKKTYLWNDLRKAINNKLSSLRINEDKLLGPYFISPKIFNDENFNDKFIEIFKNKVLMYLYDDAAKQKRHSLFSEKIDISKYSSICKEFDKIGINIFCSEIASLEPETLIEDNI